MSSSCDILGSLFAAMAAGKPLESILRMKGGDDEFSYARNCSSQTNLIRSVRPLLEDTVMNMNMAGLSKSCKTFCVADLGCSSSHNSIFAVETIMAAAKRKCMIMESLPPPEFHVYFNDLPSNDFNSLFARLTPEFTSGNSNGSISNNKTVAMKGRVQGSDQGLARCFYAGVPGSFYRRLFPRDSLHFVHSSCSLHWLSKIPDAIQDKSSKSYNKWETFIARNGSYAVAQAYLEQFKSDFNAFLSARAHEVIEGGVMFLVFPCRISSDPREQGSMLSFCGKLLVAAFRDLITEGLLDEDKLHSFNLPFFSPTMEEFKSIVKTAGFFTVQRCEVLRGESAGMLDNKREDCCLLGRQLSQQYRNGLETMIEAHIGADMGDELFQRVEKRGAEKSSEWMTQMESLTHLLAVLIRNNKMSQQNHKCIFSAL